MEEDLLNLVEYPDLKVALILIPKRLKNYFWHALNKHTYFSEEELFYSQTESKEELSLFIDQRASKDFLHDEVNIIYNYRLIQIYEQNSGIENIGIAKKISSVFADNKISIIYINTFNNNFILIPESNYEQALKTLLKTNFIKN